jgi:Sec-independent protein secretion pathway component TatC
MKKRAGKKEVCGAEPMDAEAPLEQSVKELDRRLNLVVLIIIVILLLCVIFIPGGWLNSASMWCRDHIPGF